MQGGVHVHSPFLPDHHCDQHRDRREQPERSVEAAQIIVGAKSAALTRVNLTASDLSDGFGHTLDRSNLTFFREYFINFAGVVEGEPGNRPVPANSPTNDPNLADPLIPFVDPYTTTTDGFSQTVGPLWQFMTIVVEQRVYLPMARKS